MRSWIGFHRTLVGNAFIPGEIVYLGIEKVRSRGSPGICRGGREAFNFDICDNVSTKPALSQNGGVF
jgi:hypothetical protein